MDFRPLIKNGRRRFTTIASSSPMVIIKKKSPSPMNNNSFEQKQFCRSIPVSVTSSNKPIVVSTMITSSLSSSPSSSSATSTNAGTVSVPIQVIKTQNSNNDKNNIVSTAGKTNDSQKGYRYFSKQVQQVKPLTNGDVNGPTRMPSSSSIGGDGDSLNSALWMDSNVLRLIRRYDPTAASAISIRSRRSLENNRRGLHENNEKSKSSLTSNSSASCSFLPQRASTVASLHEDNCSIKQSLTPRLQRQQTIYEQDTLASSPTITAAHRSTSARPILKYTPPTSRVDVNAQSKKSESLTQPLSIEIEPHVPSSSSIISNENTITYQPLITTGTKRVCAAISKSEWDLRFQHDPFPPIVSSSPSTFPVQPSSPHTIANQQQEKEPYRPLFDRNESSIGTKTNNEQKDNRDDIHEYSSPNTVGSCVEKLKQIFNTKPSLELTTSPTSKQQQKQHDSIETNINRHLNTNETTINKSDLSSVTPTLMEKMSNTNTIESTLSKIPADLLLKSTNTNQENLLTSSPLLKRPILKSQKAFDSTELLERSNSGNLMPTSEISYDAYRFRRLNDQDQMAKTRLKNVAKVEPYSVNTNLVRPLYHLANSQPTTTTTTTATTTTTPSKTYTIQNNTINNLPNSLTSSAASLNGTIRHPNVRNSDFLVPNPAYSKSVPAPPLHPPSTSSPYPTPPTSMLLSESLSHVSPRRIPQTAHTALSNERSTGFASSVNNSKQKHQSSTQPDFHSGKHAHSPATYRDANGTIVNKNHYEEFDNYTPLGSYHYRPKEYTSSTTAINNSFANNRQLSQGLICPSQVEQLQHDRFNIGQQQQSQQSQQNQSRRRFQRRKQMKRSKSADLYQDLTSTSSKNQNNHNCFFPSTTLNESNRYHRQQRSISRDLIGGGGGGGDGNLSSSSSSSSLSTANIERINRAALLRYKSLDSMTFNNRNASLNAKTSNRRALSKPTNADFDSDDSVCGIPKPRKTIGR